MPAWLAQATWSSVAAALFKNTMCIMSNQSEGQKTQENTADMQAPKNKNPPKHGGFFYGSLNDVSHTAPPAPAFDHAGQHPSKR